MSDRDDSKDCQDWQGGPPEAELHRDEEGLRPAQVEQVYEAAREALVEHGIPWERAVHLAEEIRERIL